MSTIASWFKKGALAVVGAALMTVGFFEPWLFTRTSLLTWGGLSAHELTQILDDAMAALFWLLPIIAGLAVIFFFWGLLRPRFAKWAATGLIVISLLGLALPIAPMNPARASFDQIFSAAREGFWLTAGGLLLILISGIIALWAARNESSYAEYDGYSTYDGGVMTTTTPAYNPPAYNPPAGDMPAGGAAMSATTDLGGGGRIGDFGDPAPFTVPGAAVSGPPSPARATEVLNRPPEALAWLVMREGPRAGHTFRVSENTNIGRDAGNDIIIDDTSLSGQHAKIKLEDGKQFMLYDLASTNGVFIYDAAKSDWERVYRVELSDGQQVKLGRTVLSFMHLSPDKAAKA